MLRPSYAELMDVMSENSKEAVTSRYTVVIAASKRARQLIDGDESMAEVKANSNKPVSIAVEEIKEGKIIVVPEGQGTKLKPKVNPDEYEIKKELEERAADEKKNDEEEITEAADEIDEVNEDDMIEEEFDINDVDIEESGIEETEE